MEKKKSVRERERVERDRMRKKRKRVAVCDGTYQLVDFKDPRVRQ